MTISDQKFSLRNKYSYTYVEIINEKIYEFNEKIFQVDEF